jgi:hypothetical protein
MSHSIETYEREDGKRGWRIVSGGDVVANDAGQGYNNEQDSLDALFGMFFGAYDDSFLELYQKWQSYAGEKPPGSETGPNVWIQDGSAKPPEARDADAPNYESETTDMAERTSAERDAEFEAGAALGAKVENQNEQ